MFVDLFQAQPGRWPASRSAVVAVGVVGACSSCKQRHWVPSLAVRARRSSCSSSAWSCRGTSVGRGPGGHGRRHPGHRRRLPQRIQERPRVRGAQRPQGLAAGQGAARRRSSTRSPLEEVVVGDAVVLETGDEIPADGRLLKATELYVDQSLMTGESEPVRKQAAAARRHRRRAGSARLPLPRHPGRGRRRPDARHRGRRRHLPGPDRPQAVGRRRGRGRGRGRGRHRGEARQAQADHLQGTDAAAAEADEPGRPDQQGRLHRRRADLPGPAGARHVRREPAKSSGRSPARTRSRCAGALLELLRATWSSSSSWRCRKGCR